MKDLIFLFAHFNIFLIVWSVVILDFGTTILDAKLSDSFSFALLPDVLKKLVYYSVYLMFGNIAEYYSAATGQNIGMVGILAVSGIILSSEAGQFKKKISKIFKL